MVYVGVNCLFHLINFKQKKITKNWFYGIINWKFCDFHSRKISPSSLNSYFLSRYSTRMTSNFFLSSISPEKRVVSTFVISIFKIPKGIVKIKVFLHIFFVCSPLLSDDEGVENFWDIQKNKQTFTYNLSIENVILSKLILLSLKHL